MSDWNDVCPICGTPFACVEVDTVDDSPTDLPISAERPGPMTVECRRGHRLALKSLEYSVVRGYRYEVLNDASPEPGPTHTFYRPEEGATEG